MNHFCIDCQVDDIDAAARFWSQALRRQVKPAEDDRYRDLRVSPSEPIILLQKVSHPSRVHLDPGHAGHRPDASVASNLLRATRPQRLPTSRPRSRVSRHWAPAKSSACTRGS